jgi:hypothetical protein
MTTRTATQRRTDTLEKLQLGHHVWIASANPNGTAHLIAAAYSWDGEKLTVAIRERSKTAQNLLRAGWARMALPSTEDSVVVEGPLEVISLEADEALATAHAAAAGWDARLAPEPYLLYRLTPTRVQAMQAPEEEPDRTIMREGQWLDD